jgi:hypothetical protein
VLWEITAEAFLSTLWADTRDITSASEAWQQIIGTTKTGTFTRHSRPGIEYSLGSQIEGISKYQQLKEKSAVQKTKLHGLSPRANYTDRATAACRRSDCQLLRIEGATWSAW